MNYLDYDFWGDCEWEEQSKSPEFIFEIIKNPINALRPSERPMKVAKTLIHKTRFGPSFQITIEPK